MAKIGKPFTLDEEVIDELKNVKNASKLVNELLIEHLFGTKSNIKEEISRKLRELTVQKEEIETKMITLVQKYDRIEAKEKEQKHEFRDIPPDILEDFNRFPDMSEEVLKSRWEGKYKESGVDWQALKGFYARFVSFKTTKE